MFAAFALLFACDVSPPPTQPTPEAVERLSTDAHTLRVSMLVRGVRPTVAELDQVAADPAALEALVDGWLETPAFGEVMKDLHADAWGLRADEEEQWPPLGPLAGFTQADLAWSLGEEPLALVADVVASGRPYTDILLSDAPLADEIVALATPIAREPGQGWTPGRWTDGRPPAGILSSTAMWRRHTTNLSGKHRQRGLFVAQRLLCDDLRARDFPVVPLDGIASEEGINDSVGTNPNCVSCHATLDPLSAFFWGFNENLRGAAVADAYASGCDRSKADLCYPAHIYHPEDDSDWGLHGLPEPGFYGAQAETLTDLAERIAADPRFPQCAARRFEGWFTHTQWNLVPDARVDELTAVFLASGLDAKALVKAIVLDPAFSVARPGPGEGVPLLDVRPEEYARTLADLTGIAWRASPDSATCEADNTCWGEFELLLGARYGYRVLAGGSDGVLIPSSTGASPGRVAAYEAAAADLAGRVVDSDTADPSGLLGLIETTDRDEARVRTQLAALHLRLLGERLATDDPALDASYDLWHAESQRTSPEAAWKVMLYALFTDPAMWLY